jgi:hypothetical protein
VLKDLQNFSNENKSPFDLKDHQIDTEHSRPLRNRKGWYRRLKVTMRQGKFVSCRLGVKTSLCEKQSILRKDWAVSCQIGNPTHGMHSMILGRQFSPFYSQLHSLGA